MWMGPWKMGPWKIWNKDWVEYVIGKMENGKRIRNQKNQNQSSLSKDS